MRDETPLEVLDRIGKRAAELSREGSPAIQPLAFRLAVLAGEIEAAVRARDTLLSRPTGRTISPHPDQR